MLKFNDGGQLIQPGDDLPCFKGTHKLYLDFETTSGDPDITSLNTWRNCYIAGIAITAEEGDTFYLPLDHRDTHWNLPRERVIKWLEVVLSTCDEWVNHNVKYDMHVAAGYELTIPNKVSCTLTRAKILDSDKRFRGGYGLDALALDWLECDISKYDNRVRAFLKGCKSKDYGDVPADILGEYACHDVIVCRQLDAYLERRMPEQCRRVEATEKLLTPVIFDMECEGLRVDPTELATQELLAYRNLLDLDEQISQLVGQPIRAHVNEDCFRLLCGTHGLPVLAWTDDKEPSFDKNTLASYLKHPRVDANPDLKQVVLLILKYRKLNTLTNLFIKTYRELHIDGILHPSFNQCVTTGRMSCSEPNMQQLSDEAKGLIHAPPGEALLSGDYSQIEFRLIAHLINNQKTIQAYIDNPDTDFHQWVADMSAMDRDSAKNLNFAMGYGAGRTKTLYMLENNPKVLAFVAQQVDDSIRAGKIAESKRQQAIEYFVKQRADKTYTDYHVALPELKATQKEAEWKCRSRGYVFNLYGRHRHLPISHGFAAFNSVAQASAADLMKERLVAIAPRYNSDIRNLGLRVCCVVHDEFLFVGPTDVIQDPDTHQLIAGILELPSVKLRVPIRVSMCWASTTWAATKHGPIVVPR